MKNQLFKAEMNEKKAKLEVEEMNNEIRGLCDQIIKIRSQYEKEFKDMQERNLRDAKKQGAAESEIDRKIARLGEIQFIVDEKNAI
jgi:hypothetical protein